MKLIIIELTLEMLIIMAMAIHVHVVNSYLRMICKFEGCRSEDIAAQLALL